MAINKKLIHFKNKENFDREVANGNILDTSICFIQDTKEIWTHSAYFGGKELTKITYAELKALRDNSQLNEGHLYRITDYVTTTTQMETKSANHPFDIIVLATSVNKLSHLARAIQHEGDTYFGGNDLSAWELWYDLDNDTNKYEWADVNNGKGVIYRMIDEKRNDCPYDFKNILFYNTNYTESTTSDNYYFTFSYVVSDVLYDGTVEQQVKGCYDNSIKRYILYKKHSLNKNVFRNIGFENNCHSNIFESRCYNNTFEDNCHSNTFESYCNNNTFGKHCHSNTFGTSCDSNTFEIYCNSNTFGNSCNNNTFGTSCDSNTFESHCNNNTFGKHCYSNTFGTYCDSNTFESYCYNNTFGNSCCYNTFVDNTSNRYSDQNKIFITLNDEYYDDGTNQLVPIKHPDLSTQPNILPYKFMGQYVYEQLIPVKRGDRIVSCDFAVEQPTILSAGVFGVNSFKNIDIMATKSDAMLLNSESGLTGYISIRYTNASPLLPSSGFGYYGYEDNTENAETLAFIDFELSPDGTVCIYDPNTEVLSLYKSGEITQDSIPQNLPKKNVILGEGVTSIGGYAFNDCSGLTSVTIGNSVTSIGARAFSSCSGLTSVTIPNSVKSIGAYAFDYCSGLTSVHISDIAAWCNIDFSNASSNPLNNAHHLYLNGEEVKDLVIPNSVTSIKNYAFSGCSGLTSVTIGNSVESIGNYAFTGCSGLTSVTIPNSVTSIGSYAFSSCSGLTSVTIPNSVTSIGARAFNGCSGLTSVTIPNSVKNIGGYAFRNCSHLEKIELNCKNIGRWFSGFKSIKEIIIGNSVTSIEDNAFSSCSGLTSVAIPNSVTSIGNFAFGYCSGLTSITCEAIIPPKIIYNTFEDVPTSIPVYVPSESVDAYKSTQYWYNFTNIQAI